MARALIVFGIATRSVIGIDNDLNWRALMAQKMFTARIIPAGGGSSIVVTVPANDSGQARNIIENQYGPVKSWVLAPSPAR
jgi:hypothetical protein